MRNRKSGEMVRMDTDRMERKKHHVADIIVQGIYLFLLAIFKGFYSVSLNRNANSEGTGQILSTVPPLYF